MLRTTTCIALLAATLACRSSEPEPPPPGIAGGLLVEDFHVPEGETVWVDGDLTISATGAIVVEGRLVARDAAALERQDAPRIELVSAVGIDVAGEVLGGRGADARRTRGGRGSSVLLTAPLVRVHGRVVAGAGGEGGRSLPGGRGGDADIRGMFEGSGEPGHVELVSGAGGRGGAPGGNGGASGHAIAREPTDDDRNRVELRARALEAFARVRGT